MGISDFNFSRAYFWGDVMCFVSMLFFAWYLALGRRNRHYPSLWVYVVPLYAVAGVFCLGMSLFFVNPFRHHSGREMLLVLALAVVPTVLGHSILNYSMKHLRGQAVSVLNMGQFVFAGIMAYFIFGEVPVRGFYMACLLLVSGACVAVAGLPGREQRAEAGTTKTPTAARRE